MEFRNDKLRGKIFGTIVILGGIGMLIYGVTKK